jgi:mono/diheme cytochrome c family protein
VPALLFTLICSTVVSISSAEVQQVGNAATGAVYAKEVCAQCHAIDRTGTSPEPTAPPFREVANTPGMTGTALRVWLSTSHPTMPNIVLERHDMENVIAFILSLKE